MHVFRVLAALVLGCLVGELAVGPAFDLLARTGSPHAAAATVVAVPCLVGAVATAVALLVLPVKAVR